jgi:hypothetical protein
LQKQDSAPRGPYSRFIYAIKSDETKRKYVKRFELFLDYNKFEGMTIDEKAENFFKFSKDHGVEETNDIILNYMSFQIDRAKRNEISNQIQPFEIFTSQSNFSAI